MLSDARATLNEAVQRWRQKDPAMRGRRFLLSVVHVQIKAGLQAEALLTLDSARQTDLNAMGPMERVGFLVLMAGAQRKAGLAAEALLTLDAAQQTVMQIKNVVAPVDPFVDLARGWANAGWYHDAAEFARAIKDVGRRGDAFVSIAQAQAGAGLLAEANATLDEALQWTRQVHESLNGSALGRIGEARAGAGRIADALAIADSIKGNRSGALRIRVLCASAEHAARRQ